MCSARGNTALPVLGSPIRKSAGQWLFSASPRLIAAVHVLHRLLVPRHPPCALTILTVIIFRNKLKLQLVQMSLIKAHLIPIYIVDCAVFKVREEAATPGTDPMAPEGAHHAGLVPVSQNSTACSRRG